MELRRRESAPEPRRRFCPLGDTWADMSPAAPPYADVLASVAEFARPTDPRWRAQLSHCSGRVQVLKVGVIPVRHAAPFTKPPAGPPM
jgi:hypothetical protein